ncbi:hypothetical protein QR77_41405 [Streptomyces sp. 150FB]|uniref:hypothetical protein n=1 Tax=Streptomyces sp. 150FB TaxID=1576605 RepID=UPI0005896878|nr:hypothetical protein [Streptomyces sp. 150FB]KIF72744.1 hypothetical protein QR77_41405 [Streptomyces sp. 150FB]
MFTRFFRRRAVPAATPHPVPVPAPAPPVSAPVVLCTACGCTAINGQVCGDGCHGVLDQDTGCCEACLDPSVIIDWSTACDGDESECALCGAPFYARRRYCSAACEAADGDGEDDEWDPGIQVSLVKARIGYADEPPF